MRLTTSIIKRLLLVSVYLQNRVLGQQTIMSILNHISISILDYVGADYTNDGSMSQYEDDKDQEIDFLKRGRDFPIERLQNGMKVIVRHLETGEERVYSRFRGLC